MAEAPPNQALLHNPLGLLTSFPLAQSLNIALALGRVYLYLVGTLGTLGSLLVLALAFGPTSIGKRRSRHSHHHHGRHKSRHHQQTNALNHAISFPYHISTQRFSS